MKTRQNPFEYEGANNLSVEEILDFYMEDFNYSRFIQSTRNIFLVGERGTGKTMALLYNSFKIQYLLAKRNKTIVSFDKIAVHIPCNTPIFHKKEHLLIENDFKAAVVSEHYLVLSIVSEMAKSLSEIEEIETSAISVNDTIKENFGYILGINLHKSYSFLKGIKLFLEKEIVETQRKINNPENDEFYSNALSFSSLVLPFINYIKTIPILRDTHFMLLMDDAHDLNKFQIQVLNSWIAYRDHSNFSFKVATARVGKPSYLTSSGGAILEGHDFTSIEMGKSLLNKDSEFAKMALGIIEKRLKSAGILVSAHDFFPENASFVKDLEESKNVVAKKAKEKYPHGTTKQINDYIYKYHRSEYFRNRSDKANLPPYSGFDTIVNISTGVVRNLLDPCYWMYDAELSKQDEDKEISKIPSSTQNQIIIARSEAKWEILKNLHKSVDGCTEEQAKQIHQLFENLMELFKERLKRHKSEPRAIKFSISQKTKEFEPVFNKLKPLLIIAQRAQLLYTRPGYTKENSKDEIFYVPNRILLPSKGLDPIGQYAHVQLKAIDILAAAEQNKAFPFVEGDESEKQFQIKLPF